MADVSSWFIDQANDKSPPNIERILQVGTCDLSERVQRWPSFERNWNDLRPLTAQIQLANDDGGLNEFREDKTRLRCTGELRMGFKRFGGAMATNPGDRFELEPSGANSGYSLIVGSHHTYEAYITIHSDSITYAGYYLSRRGNHFGLSFTTQRKFALVTWSQSDTSLTLTDPTSREIGKRYHTVGVVVPGSYTALYVDGSRVGSIAMAWDSRSYDYTDEYSVLSQTGSYTAFGIIDEAKLYDFAMTDEQAYNASRSLSVGTPVFDLGLDEADVRSAGYDRGSDNVWTRVGSVEMVENAIPVGPGTVEALTLFSGTIDSFDYRSGLMKISMTDKFKQLSERVVGTRDVPQDFTTSNHLVSDLTWYVVTSFGGYSALESSSNPDVDYDAFLEWANVFSSDNARMNAYLDGHKCTEVLRKIGRLSRSAIYVQDDRLTFKRFSLADSASITLDDNNILDDEMRLDDADMVNKQYVAADYSVASDYFSITVIEVDTASVNSFGLKEDTEDDTAVWYVDSVSAQNLAQRLITTNGEPNEKIKTTTTLVGITTKIGEMIAAKNMQIGFDDTYRILGQRIDMDTGRVELRGDRSQVLAVFILDFSELDGTDVLA